MTDDFTGPKGAAWPSPTMGYAPMGPLAIDGSRLLMGRDAALVALPLAQGTTLSRSDQTLLYTSTSGEIWEVDRVGTCIVGGDASIVYGWTMPSGGSAVAKLPRAAYPVLRDDARGLFWGLSQNPGANEAPTVLKHLPTDTTCDPNAAVTLGSVTIAPQWLETDATNLYASGIVYGPGGVNDYHTETYAVPLAGGASKPITPSRPEPPLPTGDGDFQFGTLVLHVSPTAASLERVTGSEHTTVWSSGENEQIAGRAEDADSLYFATNSDTCVEMGTCPGRGPPGSTEPCCVSDHYESHLYRASK